MIKAKMNNQLGGLEILIDYSNSMNKDGRSIHQLAMNYEERKFTAKEVEKIKADLEEQIREEFFYEIEDYKFNKESIQTENQRLRDELNLANAQLKYAQDEIYRENVPLSYSYPMRQHDVSLKFVAPGLHDEIVRFQKEISEYYVNTKDMSQEIIQRIQQLVYTISPSLKVELYGSFATGLCMPSSDIDLVICNEEQTFVNAEKILKEMSQAFSKDKELFNDVKYIPGATIPILKATCTTHYNNINVDVTVQDAKHNGLKCVRLVQDYMKSYECLRYLVLPLKEVIYQSDLNDPYQGGLTSYGLILMIIAFLQFKIRNKNSISIENPNLGTLFIEFLNFYMNFDYTGTEIVPLPPGSNVKETPFQKLLQPYNEYMNCMKIRDPLNPQNNVSRSAHKYLVMTNIFYICFFSAFPMTGSELKDVIHFNERDKSLEEEFYYLNINPRRYSLLKIFNSAKSFSILNKSHGSLES